MKDQIKELKITLNVTSDEQLARKLDISAATIAKWKSGKINPSNMAKQKIDLALKNCRGANDKT